MCCCFREYLSAAYQAAYSDQLWSMWSNFKMVAWIQGMNNTKSWGKIPQILKLNYRHSKHCSQFLKHSNDSLWTKSSGILVFTAMSSTYCIARTLSCVLMEWKTSNISLLFSPWILAFFELIGESWGDISLVPHHVVLLVTLTRVVTIRTGKFGCGHGGWLT